MLQLETKISSSDHKFGRQLFKLYEKQIVRLVRKVRDIFTADNIAIGFANLRCLRDIINNNTSQTKILKLPLYQNLINPCFLLAVCFELKLNKGTREIARGASLLAILISLASVFFHKKYMPKSIKRIFIPRARGDMRPFGVVSLKDNIVQQVLKFILTLRFERVFSYSSYGFRLRHNPHSALKHIYIY